MGQFRLHIFVRYSFARLDHSRLELCRALKWSNVASKKLFWSFLKLWKEISRVQVAAVFHETATLTTPHPEPNPNAQVQPHHSNNPTIQACTTNHAVHQTHAPLPCTSTKTPIPPHLTQAQWHYMILLLGVNIFLKKNWLMLNNQNKT